MQQSLFDIANDNTPIVLDMPDAEVIYSPNFIQPKKADDLFQSLMSQIEWRQDQLTMYGKTFDIPRLQAWYGDQSTSYTYSGLRMQPKPWFDDLHSLKVMCEESADTRFNSVLANLYRDGRDGVGRHADDEAELGDFPIIASLSFGAVRYLDFYHNQSREKRRIALEHGSMLLMKGATQNNWQHAVAKTQSEVGARINLTFRYIKKNTNF
jgi:alkylated DNA repair dioxygenase AlkB